MSDSDRTASTDLPNIAMHDTLTGTTGAPKTLTPWDYQTMGPFSAYDSIDWMPVQRWRRCPGYYNVNAAHDTGSILILLKVFLNDQTGKSPFGQEYDKFYNRNPDERQHTYKYDWGKCIPLEKVIMDRLAMLSFLQQPRLVRSSFYVIEPWPHVGVNPATQQPVRASKNVAYILQKVCDADTVLIPIWHTGVWDADEIAYTVSTGVATIFEGGDGASYDPSSFTYPNCPLDHILQMAEQLIIHRAPAGSPTIFLCLGHQVCAEAHIRLLRRAAAEVDHLQPRNKTDPLARALNRLKPVLGLIKYVGENLEIKKGLGGDLKTVATGWEDPQFANSKNEMAEMGVVNLHPYVAPQDRPTFVMNLRKKMKETPVHNESFESTPHGTKRDQNGKPLRRSSMGGEYIKNMRKRDSDSEHPLTFMSNDSWMHHIPEELVAAHDLTVDEFSGVLEEMMEYQPEVSISMFHIEEVNEEAILFANWAYRKIHDTIVPYRHLIAGSPLSWLLRLPYAVRILASTRYADHYITEAAATCINYKDYETGKIHRSFTCQFHPELLDDLRDISSRDDVSYSKLKKDNGARLFCRLIYACLNE
eukprot:Clim_evm3s221 gene=Clim_evmTU3s221